MGQFFRRMHYLLDRRRRDDDLANDLEFHREMAGRDGAPLGNLLQLREQARDAWGWTWIDRLAQDLRYAARMLRKSPGFTVVAVLMLAVGIGVNVAVFGFFDFMVLRPIDIRDPETLLRFHRRSPQNFAYSLPYPEVAFFREHSRTLSAVLALNFGKAAMEGEEKQLATSFVTANFFTELGATPVIGRLLDAVRDDGAGATPVVVLDQGFWRRHFGGDPLVVGRTIRLNGKPATVVGVASNQFSGLSMNEPALYAPISQQPYFAGGSRLLTSYDPDAGSVRMWGRLQPGLTPRAAEEELASLAAELHKQHPNEIWEKEGIPSDPGGYAQSLLIGDRSGSGAEGKPELYPVFAMIAALGVLILAVACGNLGSLLLARGVAREREITIRTAVGAGKGRLVRQLFTESVLLALLGSGAGLVLGYVVLRGLMAATQTPAWLIPALDWRAAVFALGAGFASAVLFGLAPAIQAARQRHRATLARQILVGAQVAASCVLLIVAGLLGRALDHAISANPGFEYRQVISIDPGLARHGYSTARAQAFLDAFEERLRGLPGVEAVALAQSPPLGNRTEMAGVTLNGRPMGVQINRVDPQFFETMKVPLVRGRNLLRGEAHAIMVSESLARSAWPGEDPLGKKFTMDEEYTVVGVAGSARLVRLEDSDSVEVYFPLRPADLPSTYVLAKTAGAPEDLARAAEATAKAVDANTFPEIQLMKSGFQRKLKSAESSALAVSVLGLVADLLACIGIIGVAAYAVSQRTREIGIRMALGARPTHILAVVLLQFGYPVAAGLLAGAGGAAALSGLLRGKLYGISHLDPMAYVGAMGLFVLTVAVAALWPARRALRIDPMQALRHD